MKLDIGRAMTVLGTNPDRRHTMADAGRQRVWDEFYASVLGTTANTASPSLV